jgi:undecaprenyl-diphosphooligosaccharide--protein glycosyltransferase
MPMAADSSTSMWRASKSFYGDTPPMLQSKPLATTSLIFLIALAYLFSFTLRMIWVYQFYGDPAMMWNGQLMINTNDGYFFASGAQQVLEGMHPHNARIPELAGHGTVLLTVLLSVLTPLSLESVLLYLPALVSSLVVIPIILIARLYGQSTWGFFAALLGSIAWSYYNRTMAGYYDTDMFSAMAPMFILYFLMKSTIDFHLRSALYAAIAITLYPFLYDQGASIVYAMGILYALYLLWYHRLEILAYQSIVLIFLAMIPYRLPDPYELLTHLAVVLLAYRYLPAWQLSRRALMRLSLVLFVALLVFGNVLGIFTAKISGYLSTGTQEGGLRYFSVYQTVREAGKIEFDMFAKRISGSQIGILLSLAGYILLTLKHRAFLLALPLVGIGTFALFGGLRFTVYAVPIAAMGAIYLFVTISELLKQRLLRYGVIFLATAAMLYPNIRHIIAYQVPTVLTSSEVEDLQRLKEIAHPEDYTISWWDYGYPLWFYSETNTLIDGGKHGNDNYLVSKIFQTTSPQLASGLGRLAVETYVDSNHTRVTYSLFDDKKQRFLDPLYHLFAPKNQIQHHHYDPDLLLAELETGAFVIPPKRRDIYLYLPWRMFGTFPTIARFANLDLKTGRPLREMLFYPTRARAQKQELVHFEDGSFMDTRRGLLSFPEEMAHYLPYFARNGKKDSKRWSLDVSQLLIVTHDANHQAKIQTQSYTSTGQITLLYLERYRQFVILDNLTLQSMYVQMGLLGRYDSRFFEPVLQSPYTQIYRFKQ